MFHTCGTFRGTFYLLYYITNTPWNILMFYNRGTSWNILCGACRLCGSRSLESGVWSPANIDPWSPRKPIKKVQYFS